ncbi:MAG TPA: cob(I)yrinic acid a,c-diamide adenosyltransferase [Puia sp.]|nr:cob(I)yrinic acid a,c-diamide adenosyltransferase [Puia sp.]
MAFKIYTRTGDKGKTALIGGTKVPKSNIRIESYGTVDELNSFIGLLNDHLSIALASLPTGATGPAAAAPAPPTDPVSPGTPNANVSAFLREIQDRLFTIGASLACDPDKESKMKIPDLKEEDIDGLEKEMDRMDEVLPDMKSFILPGGHVAVSTAHIARCVCRRAERICVEMQEQDLYIEPVVLKYLNRLSDYLFVLARWAGHVLNTPEIPWKPRISGQS